MALLRDTAGNYLRDTAGNYLLDTTPDGSGGGGVLYWVFCRPGSRALGADLMYPRNAASPPRIAIGPVVQISDGAVQTSGVSVKIKPEGGSASAGGGTVSYEEGVVAYVPTQAETDYAAFQVIAYKTGCIPAAVTVVTSASATAGKVVLSGETHTNAVIPTVTTLTNAVTLPSSATISITGDITGNLSGSVGSVTGAVGSVSGTVGGVSSAVFAVLLDNSLTAAKIVSGAITAAKFAAGAIDAAALAADAGSEIASAVRSELTTELGRIDAAISSRLASASYSAPLDASGVRSAVGLGAANLDAQLAAISGYVDCLPGTLDGATLTAIPWNVLWDAEIQSECADALNAYDPPTNAEMEARTLLAASYATASTLSTVAANVVLILADTGTDGVVLSSSQCNAIADHVLRRNQSNVEASSNGDSLALSSVYGLVQQIQKASAVGTTLTVKKTDGTTTLGTKTLTTDGAAEPVTGVS